MNSVCGDFRSLIPAGLLGDLSSGEQQALELHLRECSLCAQERELYLATFRQLRSASDVPAPRHFFVYSEARRASFLEALRQMSFAWKGALLAAFFVIGTLFALALAHLEVRADQGTLLLRIGKTPAPDGTHERPAFDPEALKSGLIALLEEKARNDKLEVIRTLRAELGKSESTLTRKHRALFQAALSQMESRVDSRIVDTAASLETSTQRSLAGMYRTLETQRVQDFASLNERLNRIAVTGEIKSNQTDAILETLLEVAELRLK